MKMRGLLVVITATLCTFGQAQNQISPLQLSSESQATGSNVTIYVNASSTSNVWQILWRINEVDVGKAKSRTKCLEVSPFDSQFENRINISANFSENNHRIKSEMVIMNLTKEDNLSIKVVGFGTSQTIQLNVKDCFVILNGVNTTCNFGCTTQFPCQQVPGTSYPAVCQADAQWNTAANSSCPAATTTLSSTSTELSITTAATKPPRVLTAASTAPSTNETATAKPAWVMTTANTTLSTNGTATTTLSSTSTELSITTATAKPAWVMTTANTTLSTNGTGPKSNNKNHGAVIAIVVVLCIIVLVLVGVLVYRWRCRDNGFIRGKSSS